MKKYTVIFTGSDNKSHFKEEVISADTQQPLGLYSKKMTASGMMFRTFEAGLEYPWHNAPQPQYIIYLEGRVEVEVGDGDKRIFSPGDILFVTDLEGEGHVSRMLTAGTSIIVTA